MATITLSGHTSFETAHETEDYPYGFRLRTQRREWIERKPKFGDRYVTCTRNPNTGKWNKPKASTYHEVAVLTLDDDTGHVSYTALGYHDCAETIGQFENEHGHVLSDEQRDAIQWLRAARLAESQVTYRVVAGPTYARNPETGKFEPITEGDPEYTTTPRQSIQEQAELMHRLTVAAYRGDLT